MSTRAILGIVQSNGSFLGAWQWNDGGNILELLNRKFVDDKSVKDLLSVGMWSTMWGPRQYKEHLTDTIRNFEGNPDIVNRVKSAKMLDNGVYFVRDYYHDNIPKVYKSVLDALGQDVNYVYVYFPKLHKWKRYTWGDSKEKLKRDNLI